MTEVTDVTDTVFAGTNPEGRRLLRIEARNAQTPIERKPEWIRTRLKTGPEYLQISELVKREGLHTVCQEAGCPNIYECWEDREATFLIGGEQCTRRCDFCQIDTGKPAPLDTDEPRRVAESIRTMNLRYATITGVARDDLPDQGAWLYAETVRMIKELNPNTGVEVLIPDFSGVPVLLQQVFDAQPAVLAHNLETVPRIFKSIRPAFSYGRSLDVLTQAKAAGMITKSNLILGMGEEISEVEQALADLHHAGCDLITITQYLRPSPRHHPVSRWVRPEEFVALSDVATQIGFAGVMIVVGPKLSGTGGRYHLLMLAAAPVFAGSFLLTKALTRYESPGVIVAWQSITVSIFSLPLALLHWQWPGPWQWATIVLCGVLGSAGHYSLTRSFISADISATQSAKFLDLVWSAAMGWLLFSDVPSHSTLVGGTVICAATIWVAHREARSKGREVAAASEAGTG